MRGYRTGACFLIAVTLLANLAWGGDAITDAKRKAAADLMKEGKTADAIAMIGEVIKVDPENYKDHLLLARGYDKLNKAREAAEQYRHTLTLMTAASIDDRASRAEIDRRLKVLDAQMNKIQAAEDEFMKKLDQLEREAIAAKDAAAVRRIFRLKGGVFRAQERPDRTGAEVIVSRDWQDAAFVVTAGRSYRVRAVGAFQVKAGVESTADGTSAVAPNYQGPIGQLLARVDYKPALIHLGSSTRFTPENSGKLIFQINPSLEENAHGSGSVTVLIEAE